MEHTKIPWKLIIEPGKDSVGFVEPDSEPYDLATAKIVSPDEFTSAKGYNPKTNNFDIPIPKTIISFVWDDREDDDNILNNAKFVVLACNSYAQSQQTIKELLEALKKINRLCSGDAVVYSRVAIEKASKP
jgi:hypothetical protein